MTLLRVSALLVSLALIASSLDAKDETKLKVGDAAPEFSAQDEKGNTWKSSEHVGKGIVVVYFYPADFTGGCTKQACGFRDDMEKLQAQGVTVVGVSGDTVQTHAWFKDEYELPYTLLADPQGNVAKTFGVPVRAGGKITRNIDGKDRELERGATAARWTFVINADGKIALVNTNVQAAKDSKAVLEVVEALKK